MWFKKNFDREGAQRITKGQIPRFYPSFVCLCGTFLALVVKPLAAV
jgi:hypothetical protein